MRASRIRKEGERKAAFTDMRLLIIDDEPNIRKTTGVMLQGMGHETVDVSDGSAALKHLDKAHFDVAFLDLKLNGEDGLTLLPKLLKSNPQLDVVVFTAFASIETAVKAMQLGASDYIPKPFTPEQIRQTLNKLIKTRKLQGRVAELEEQLSVDSPGTDLTTEEPAVDNLYQLAFKAAATPATILILGESGTGKSILARAIHQKSHQKENAFVTVSCPSLSRELLESDLFGHVKGAFTGATGETWGKVAMADGGTLFLDEIGELPLEIQPKLLRLLHEKEYERVGEAKARRAKVRLIAATNRNLEAAVQEGRFREDLYYRLNVISLHLPPMRERKKDLVRMANHYLEFFATQCRKQVKGFSDGAFKAIQEYSWPGNLRELRNAIERAVILSNGKMIDKRDLPEKLWGPNGSLTNDKICIGAKISLEEIEKEHIRQIVRQASTIEEAAHVLDIDPATLYRKRKKLAL